MTVEDLRVLLLQFPDDALVVLSKDAEGNGHSPLSSGWQGFYEPETPWYGCVYDERDIKECELDASKMKVAVILGPVN